MKKVVSILVLAAIALGVNAQNMKDVTFQFTEASDLTLCGKMFNDTPTPYQRMDFSKSDKWSSKDINLLEMSSGISVAFETDSPIITVKVDWLEASEAQSSGFGTRGFDLYIKKDGKWLWAGIVSGRVSDEPYHGRLVGNMKEGMKECLLYLPLYSKEKSVQIGTKEGSVIRPGKAPFRHKICLHGSSYMHGSNTSRAGATVPAYLTRLTGLQFCSLGVGGDCFMQPSFREALTASEADAFVFDAFSNGSDKTIEKNLFAFIESIQSTHPGVPLIFMSSIYREKRNFDTVVDKSEADKDAMARKLMAEAVKKYKDVYFIESNASNEYHDTTADGTHPCSDGYWIWALSVKKQIVKILGKYGIK